MIEQTKERLNQMKLFGALSSFDTRLNEGTQHGWGNADFFSAVIDDEYMYRQERKTRRLILSAKFRTEASFEKLDTTAKRNLSRSQISDFKNLTFLRSPRNVLI